MGRLSVDDLPETPSLRDHLLEEPDSPPPPGSGALGSEQIRAGLRGRGNQTLLRSSIERGRLQSVYESKGLVRVKNVLRPEVAEALHQCLEQRVPWKLAYFDEEGDHTTRSLEELEDLSTEERRELYHRIGTQADGRFQNILDWYGLRPGQSDLLVDGLPTFVTTPPVQDLVESITGTRFQPPVDARATRMRPGHFLRMHDDSMCEGFTCVLQLTRDWLADWGGVFHALDRSGAIVESYVPSFNSMVIFQTPMVHYVSMVTPWAQRPRYIVNLPAGQAKEADR